MSRRAQGGAASERATGLSTNRTCKDVNAVAPSPSRPSRSPVKQRTACSLKKTTGSMPGRPRSPYSADQAGADESTRRAADWVQQNLAGFFVGPPTVTTGSVWLHDVGGNMSATPAP